MLSYYAPSRKFIIDYLYPLLNEKKNFIEIGVYKGENFLNYIDKFNMCYAVDMWVSGFDKNDIISNENFDSIEKHFDNLMIEHDVKNFIKIKKDSISSSELFEDKFFNFVYIDANHSYDAVKKDILTWIPKVKSGCFIGGHDYDFSEYPHTYGVTTAINEIFGKPDETFKDHSWIKKL